MTLWRPRNKVASAYVDVLTSERTGSTFGYRLVGAKPGPQVVVAGSCPTAELVFDRIMSIPTLPWMKGNLILIRLDALDVMLADLTSLSPLGPIDRTLVLPWNEIHEITEVDVKRSYHSVLRACADLGMIAGRGVARLATEEQTHD